MKMYEVVQYDSITQKRDGVVYVGKIGKCVKYLETNYYGGRKYGIITEE